MSAHSQPAVRPIDIATEGGLTREQKIAMLENWKQSLEERLRATAEGMAPPAGQTANEAAMIEEIGRALRSLKA